MNKTIITCAITGAGDTVNKHPAIPVTPEQIANSAVEAAREGAAIAHIHVRDPETGKPSIDGKLYAEVVQRIRSSETDIIINLTTGPGAVYHPSQDNPNVGSEYSRLLTPEVRVKHVIDLKPEICSLDVVSMNFHEAIFMTTAAHLRQMAIAVRDAGSKPELEVFDGGHIRLAQQLISEGVIDKDNPLFQLCLGVNWGADATSATVQHLRSRLPEDAIWAAFGISSRQFPIVAQSYLLGGHVRVGLEDNLYLSKGVIAPTNADLVAKAANIIELLGGEVATPNEAREIIGLA